MKKIILTLLFGFLLLTGSVLADQGQKEGDRFCKSERFCIFDGIPNIALGDARLFLNELNNLVVDNIGPSGLDGVRQSPLPPDSTRMVTGIACPNFAESDTGTRATFLMFGDVPGEMISTLTVQNVDGPTLRAEVDFSRVGVTRYTVQIMLDGQLVAEVQDLPQAVTIFPRVDLRAVDCLIRPRYHISYELTYPVPITIQGDGTFDGDTIWIIGVDPTTIATVQTRIDNFFINTGPIEMTSQFAGPANDLGKISGYHE